eukprot:PITA_24608
MQNELAHLLLAISKEMCPKTQEDMDYMSKVPYASALRSSMYAMVCTRPYIAYAMGVVRWYMNNPGKEHWVEVKWTLRYLKGDIDNRRSTTGYVFNVGGTTVSWVSKIQSVVELSTIEAEYVAATEASKEMIWLQRLMGELGKEHDMGGDSQSVIHLGKNSAFHCKTKHIQLKYHFIQSMLEDGELKLEKIYTSQNLGDMLTKVVTREKLRICSVSIGIQE